MDDIERRVLDLLRAKAGPGARIELDSEIVAETGLDSVAVMDVVFELEDAFDVTIPLDQIADVRTVGELAAAVRALRAEAA